MNELSERARELVVRLMDSNRAVGLNNAGTLELIEQALLAERRLAMEEAAKICDEWHDKPYAGWDGAKHWRASEQISEAIRAAAEKEGK